MGLGAERWRESPRAVAAAVRPAEFALGGGAVAGGAYAVAAVHEAGGRDAGDGDGGEDGQVQALREQRRVCRDLGVEKGDGVQQEIGDRELGERGSGRLAAAAGKQGAEVEPSVRAGGDDGGTECEAGRREPRQVLRREGGGQQPEACARQDEMGQRADPGSSRSRAWRAAGCMDGPFGPGGVSRARG